MASTGAPLSISRALLTATLLTQMLQIAAAQSPSALSVPIDGSRWIGNDGTWSPVTIRIGNPVQAVDLIPNTAGQEVLVVGTDGCDGTIQCQQLRGGTFASNQSSSFDAMGDYNLGLDSNLGLTGPGFYGFDTIEIGNENEKLQKQIIGIVNSTQYWIGSMGLGTANTTIGKTQTTSLLESLAGASPPLIPSLSYGFTMGAHYQLKQVPCSLTLGGYDASRLIPNGVSFDLNDNQKPTLALSSLSMDGFGNAGNISLVGAGDQALYTVDSTEPFLWLPDNVATNIGNQLGLEYNETLGVFLYPNETQYAKVSSSSLTFNFGFSDLPGNPTSVSLALTGQALTSLNLTYGFPNLHISPNDPPIPYFPVRKAANSTQYVLGRAILQEMYLIVDYQRNNFSISQAQFAANAAVSAQLVNIMPPSNDSNANDGVNVVSSHSSTSVSPGAIAGIAVAIALVLIVAICGVAICLIRKHYSKRVAAVSAEKPPQLETRHGISRVIFGNYKVVELPAREYCPSPAMVMGKPIGDHSLTEHYGGTRTLGKGYHDRAEAARELSGSDHLAAELPESSMQALAKRGGGRHELPARRPGLSEIAKLAGTLHSAHHDGRPSPPSSIGAAEGYPTVSTLDTSSEGRSPNSPFVSDEYGSHDSSRHSFNSRDHPVSHPTTQANSTDPSRRGSRGGRAVAGMSNPTMPPYPGDLPIELAVPGGVPTHNSWRPHPRSDDGESLNNLVPTTGHDMTHVGGTQGAPPLPAMATATAAEHIASATKLFGHESQRRDDHVPAGAYQPAMGPVELPAHSDSLGRPRLGRGFSQQEDIPKWV